MHPSFKLLMFFHTLYLIIAAGCMQQLYLEMAWTQAFAASQGLPGNCMTGAVLRPLQPHQQPGLLPAPVPPVLHLAARDAEAWPGEVSPS